MNGEKSISDISTIEVYNAVSGIVASMDLAGRLGPGRAVLARTTLRNRGLVVWSFVRMPVDVESDARIKDIVKPLE